MNTYQYKPAKKKTVAIICPHCGEPTICTGRVVDEGNRKRWLDEWFCPVHGVIEPRNEEEARELQYANGI